MAVPRPEPRGYPGNLGAPFSAHAGSTRTALIDLRDPASAQEHGFAGLDAQADAVARGLVRRGLKPGDRICILSLNRVEFVTTLLGAMRAGVIPVPVNIKLAAETVRYIAGDAGAKLAFCETAYRHLLPPDLPVVAFDEGNAFADFLDAGPFTPVEPAPDTVAIQPYTSGSTGKPKGVLHTTGGYLLGAAMTHKYVFDYHEGDIYWCTADVGWVTGHSYIVYGPLANAATTLIFEGVPNYPDASRFWQVIDKHRVNTFYTAPTALRALMREGEAPVKATSRESLRLLGTVGEPINPEAWEWYFHVVGDTRCPIVDTWWQTETGSILITPLPGATDLKPGSATRPFFGVQPVLLDEQGKEIDGPGAGVLAIRASWPSQIRSVYGDHQRMIDTYFKPYPGYYFTGDGARRDEDGYYWITGRVDDVINVSGHRIGTAEVESALVLHDAVAEAAVVGYPHDVKGQGIYAYVTLMSGQEPSEDLKKDLLTLVGKEIGSFAKPELIQWAPGLPKTRSGKIMRRILRKIACNELENMGDTSTLADPSVVDSLTEQRLNR